MTHEQRALAKNAQKVQAVLDRYPDGVTLSQITGDTQLSSKAARDALKHMGAELEDGLWFEGVCADVSTLTEPVAVPKSEMGIPVSEQKQAIEMPKVVVEPEPTPCPMPDMDQLKAAPLIKEPKIPLRTQLIDLLTEHPEGVTKEHAMECMDVTLFTFKTVLQKLRREMSIDLVTRNCMSVYVMRDDLSPAPAPAPAPQEIEMQQPEQVQAEPQPVTVQQPTDLEGWVFIDSTGTFKTAPRESAAQAIEAMERLGNCKVDELMKSQGLRLAKVRVVTETLFVMGAVA